MNIMKLDLMNYIWHAVEASENVCGAAYQVRVVCFIWAVDCRASTHVYCWFVVCLFVLQRKHAQGGYQVTKQDPEELTAVCRVMEELIRMHDSVFTVSNHLPCHT